MICILTFIRHIAVLPRYWLSYYIASYFAFPVANSSFFHQWKQLLLYREVSVVRCYIFYRMILCISGRFEYIDRCEHSFIVDPAMAFKKIWEFYPKASFCFRNDCELEMRHVWTDNLYSFCSNTFSFITENNRDGKLCYFSWFLNNSVHD